MKKLVLAAMAGVFTLGLVACEQRIETDKKPDDTTSTTILKEEDKTPSSTTTITPAPSTTPDTTKPAQ